MRVSWGLVGVIDRTDSPWYPGGILKLKHCYSELLASIVDLSWESLSLHRVSITNIKFVYNTIIVFIILVRNLRVTELNCIRYSYQPSAVTVTVKFFYFRFQHQIQAEIPRARFPHPLRWRNTYPSSVSSLHLVINLPLQIQQLLPCPTPCQWPWPPTMTPLYLVVWVVSRVLHHVLWEACLIRSLVIIVMPYLSWLWLRQVQV